MKKLLGWLFPLQGAPVKTSLFYQVELLSLDRDGRSLGSKFHAEGDGEPPQWITLDGFSQDQCIDLRPYWEQMRRQGLEDLTTDVTIRETIIKFGATRQLVDDYRLILRRPILP
ncbi:MAG: hypothetical protein C0622_06840 [Desulfuromonas sp.]|nr:MAG: hypothetical protein C0622_06840 [Desulfuromonas sp.]